jgi:hypothetical protein
MEEPELTEPEPQLQPHKTTVVSAFIANINSSAWFEKNKHKYTEHYIPLMKANIDKIIFIDSTIVENYLQYENENTRIVPFVKESNYLYNHINKITNTNFSFHNPEKDTVEYMFTMAHKTEWVKMAIELVESSSTSTTTTSSLSPLDQYIWIDFGIKHMCHCSDEDFIAKVERLKEQPAYDKIRIANIWPFDCNYLYNIYQDITWYFAGSIFGGNKENIDDFAQRMKAKCLEIIDDKNTIFWETGIWYLVYKDRIDLFDPYKSNHDPTILDNY